ncbi:MAG TPA: hypothetical protein DET40_00295 [Lentisphaeria bacterium]|nr:MAG: hypothetical protein A2X45_10790 [Lentisphaerae bacterium GWF2_50_93]HCE41972.1 hypothetical protein [Lentisphaeria bacterium]
MVKNKEKSQFYDLYMDFGNLRISMSSDPDEPYTYYQQYKGKIIGESESEEKTEIGEVKLAYFALAQALSNGLSELFVLDEISMDYEQYYEALYDLGTKEIKQSIVDEIGHNNGNLLIVEDIVVFPEFRGNSFGLLALRSIMEEFQTCCGYVMLKALPLQFEARKDKKWLEDMKMDEFPSGLRKATANLAKHYEKLGFKRIGKSDFYLFCNELPIPMPDELKDK